MKIKREIQRKSPTETKGSIATWDTSGTSVGETGASEGVKKGDGREAEGNENEKKASPERLG